MQAIVLFVIVGALFIGGIVYPLSTRAEERITIERVWTDTSGSSNENGSSVRTTYFISDTAGKIYAVDNSILFWFFERQELYGKMKPGTTHDVKMYGIRYPVLGIYPVIYGEVY